MKKGSIVLVLMIISLLVSLLAFFTVPKINLIGNDVSILLNDDYVEIGYNAKMFGIDMTDLVHVNSEVDTSKVGTYKIEYSMKYYFIKVKKIRNVHVFENIKPEINLVGNIDTYVCPNGSFLEPGYTAFDNYDGDITSKVKVSVNDNYILYEVYDSSNNYTNVKRDVIYEDNIKPQIELIGGNITLKKGDSYIEQGYKAYDNCLGDITNKVVVRGSVDTSKVGTYKIEYSIDDGVNETTIKRNVYVYDDTLQGKENAPGTIYLTFDDGPSAYTKIVLDTLDKYGVKATFFIVPKYDEYKHYIKEAYDKGHSIGIHSMSHTYSIIYSSDDALYNDISRVNEVVKEYTGSYTYLYRYPGGSSNTASKYYSKGIISRSSVKLHELGYHYFDWNVSSSDADGKNHEPWEISNNVINRLSKNRANVVLMHDSKVFSAKAVEAIIEYGIANGYKFAPITMNTKEVHHSIAN